MLGLILMHTGARQLPVENVESFAYHFFNISFISVGLTRNETSEAVSKNKINLFKAPLWMALTQSAIFPLLAVAGGALAASFGFFDIRFFPTFGFFAPLESKKDLNEPLQFTALARVRYPRGCCCFESRTQISKRRLPLIWP